MIRRRGQGRRGPIPEHRRAVQRGTSAPSPTSAPVLPRGLVHFMRRKMVCALCGGLIGRNGRLGHVESATGRIFMGRELWWHPECAREDQILRAYDEAGREDAPTVWVAMLALVNARGFGRVEVTG